MPYDCTSMMIMCFLCGYCLVMIGCFMLHMPLFIRVCPYTRFMHDEVRHALANDLMIRRVRVMCDMAHNSSIRRVRVRHVSPIYLMIRRVRVLHVPALDLIRPVKIKCTLSGVQFSNVSMVLRLINCFGCLVVCSDKIRSDSEDLIASLPRDRRTGIGI